MREEPGKRTGPSIGVSSGFLRDATRSVGEGTLRRRAEKDEGGKREQLRRRATTRVHITHSSAKEAVDYETPKSGGIRAKSKEEV